MPVLNKEIFQYFYSGIFLSLTVILSLLVILLQASNKIRHKGYKILHSQLRLSGSKYQHITLTM